MFLHLIFAITSVRVQTSDFHRTYPPRFAKLSLILHESRLISFRFVVLIYQSKFLKGGDVWPHWYLVPQRQYIQYLHYPSNLSLHCILSCFQGDNCSPYYRTFSIIRSPYKCSRTSAPRPCLILLIHSFLICFSFSCSCVLCRLRLRTRGFTSQYYFFLSLWLLSYTNLRYITSYLSTSTRHL